MALALVTRIPSKVTLWYARKRTTASEAHDGTCKFLAGKVLETLLLKAPPVDTRVKGTRTQTFRTVSEAKELERRNGTCM